MSSFEHAVCTGVYVQLPCSIAVCHEAKLWRLVNVQAGTNLTDGQRLQDKQRPDETDVPIKISKTQW